MLRIDHGLHFVADQPRVLAGRRHGARIWIGQRNLLVRRGVYGDFQRLVFTHLLSQRGDLVLQPRRLGFRQLAFLTIRRLQRRQIALNARLDLLDAALNGAGENDLSRS